MILMVAINVPFFKSCLNGIINRVLERFLISQVKSIVKSKELKQNKNLKFLENKIF